MSLTTTIKTLAVAAIAAVGATSANALVIGFFNGSDLYATLTTSGGTDFDLFFNGTGVAAGAFINNLEMAGPGGTFTDSSTQTVATGTYDAGGFTDAGHTFNWAIEFPQAMGPDRLTIGEHALFSIVPTDPSAWDFNMVHINAFDAAGKSIKLVGCLSTDPTCGFPPVIIPEPQTLALLGLGLLVLGIARRRQLG